MPEPLTSYIEDCLDEFKVSFTYLSNAKAYLSQAGSKLKVSDFVAAGDKLISASTQLGQLSLHLHTRYFVWKYYLIDALEWIDDNWPSAPPAYELSMLAILEVMLTANPYQVEFFIALLDGYRQSIWDRPYNKEYYATIARAFMEWV